MLVLRENIPLASVRSVADRHDIDVLIGLAGSGVEAPDLPTEPGRGTETVNEMIFTSGCSYRTSMGSDVGLLSIVWDCSNCVGTVAALRTPG